MNTPKIKLIFGLGNPDEEYEKTYHNSGSLALDYLEGKNKDGWEKFKDEFMYKKLGKQILVKPLTFMNNSGKAVSSALKFFKAKPQEILVIHDDADIFLGNFKLSFNRNAAGQKGVESIFKALKTQEFWRLRIGIRPEKEKTRAKAIDLVLKKITPANMKKLQIAFKKAFASMPSPQLQKV